MHHTSHQPLSLSSSPRTQDDLTYKGVVFNEMKGVYSSPDSVNGRFTQQALFPDNSYAADSGGDPVDIPNLTFEEFKVCWVWVCLFGSGCVCEWVMVGIFWCVFVLCVCGVCVCMYICEQQ